MLACLLALAVSLAAFSPAQKVLNTGLRLVTPVNDAIVRTLDDVREVQGFRGPLPHVKVLANRAVSGSFLQQLGLGGVPSSQRYLLVQTEVVDRRGAVWVRTYAYDPSSHLLRFEGGRVIQKTCPH